jgi:hypothetical protein
VRDLFIEADGINRLLELSEFVYKDDTKIIAVWCMTLVNLCRGSRIPKYEKVREAISALCKAVASD